MVIWPLKITMSNLTMILNLKTISNPTMTSSVFWMNSSFPTEVIPKAMMSSTILACQKVIRTLEAMLMGSVFPPASPRILKLSDSVFLQHRLSPKSLRR